MPTFTPLLDAKLSALAGFPGIDPALVERFGRALRGAPDDYALFRMNPRALAEAHGMNEEAVVDLCIVAAKVGLLDFSFNLLCPGCGGIETSGRTWNGLGADTVHCAVCSLDVPVVLDEQVEVSFSIADGACTLGVDAFRSPADYVRCFFSTSFVRSASHARVTERIRRGFGFAPAEGEGTVSFVAERGRAYRAISVDNHTACDLVVDDEGVARAEIELVPGGLRPASTKVRPGNVDVVVHNRSRSTIGIVLLEDALGEFMQIKQTDPSRFRPFLTAKQLLNHQRFRDLFKVQELDRDLRLRIRSLTLLFTDLKGSTALYDSTGDVTAYQLVQEHFAALTSVVKQHRGAVVKTMGDAVMASFSRPEDAVAAADDMLAAMRPVNARVLGLGYQTGLKVGIHEGAALAVASDDRLDYFGQTVNIAARVQALADAGEIWVTDAVMRSPEAAAAAAARGFGSEAKRVALKGVGVPTDVYRLVR
jgi:class 3 adenylate cyclase